MLTTTAKVKSYLQISSTNYDSLIETIVKGISSSIETYLNREVGEQERTEYFDGSEKALILSSYPLQGEGLVVQVNRGTNLSPSWENVSGNDYDVEVEVGVIALKYAVSSGIRRVRVTYTGGYAEVPFDLELVATQLSAKSFDQRKAQGKSKETYSTTSIDWINTLTDEQKAVLNKYRNVTV